MNIFNKIYKQVLKEFELIPSGEPSNSSNSSNPPKTQKDYEDFILRAAQYFMEEEEQSAIPTPNIKIPLEDIKEALQEIFLIQKIPFSENVFNQAAIHLYFDKEPASNPATAQLLKIIDWSSILL